MLFHYHSWPLLCWNIRQIQAFSISLQSQRFCSSTCKLVEQFSENPAAVVVQWFFSWWRNNSELSVLGLSGRSNGAAPLHCCTFQSSLAVRFWGTNQIGTEGGLTFPQFHGFWWDYWTRETREEFRILPQCDTLEEFEADLGGISVMTWHWNIWIMPTSPTPIPWTLCSFMDLIVWWPSSTR